MCIYTDICILFYVYRNRLLIISNQKTRTEMLVFKQTLIANEKSMVPAHNNYLAAYIKSYEAVFSDLIIKVRFNLKQNQLHSDVQICLEPVISTSLKNNRG